MLTTILWRLAIVACILSIYFIARAFWMRRRAAFDRPPNAIVLLLAHHSPLNRQYLSIVASRALQREIPSLDMNPESASGQDPDAPVGDCVLGAAPHFLLFVDGAMFLVHSVPAPYVDPSEFREAFQDPTVRSAIENHCAWLSVDWMGEANTTPTFGIIGKIVAEFVGPDCLAIYYPPSEKIVANTPETVDEFQMKLRSASPIEALFGNAMPQIGG